MMTLALGNTSCVLLSLLLVTSVPVLPADSSSCDTAECEGEAARRENIWTQQQEQQQHQDQEARPGDMARVALVLGASGETGKVISTS